MEQLEPELTKHHNSDYATYEYGTTDAPQTNLPDHDVGANINGSRELRAVEGVEGRGSRRGCLSNTRYVFFPLVKYLIITTSTTRIAYVFEMKNC